MPLQRARDWFRQSGNKQIHLSFFHVFLVSNIFAARLPIILVALDVV
jgi:hypothetical protein